MKFIDRLKIHFSRPRHALAIAVFMLFLLVGPFSLIKRAIGFFGAGEGVVNFYAESVGQTASSSDYQAGWWGEVNSLGKPDNDGKSDILAFSDTNSAFYSGGDFGLAFSKFGLLDIYVGVNDSGSSSLPVEVQEVGEDEESADQNAGDDADATSTEDAIVTEETPSSSEEMIENPDGVENAGSGSEVLEDANLAPGDNPDAMDEAGQTEPQADLPQEDPGSSEPDVQIIEAPEVEAENAPAIEIIPESSHGGGEESANEPTSFLPTFQKNCFFGSVCGVSAQEESDLAQFGAFKSANLALSFASAFKRDEENGDNSADDESGIVIQYALADDAGQSSSTASSSDIVWQDLAVIAKDNLSNALNGDYLKFEAPLVKSWGDIGKVSVRLLGNDRSGNYIFYLDSLWIEATYEKADAEPELEEERLSRLEKALQLISGNLDLKPGDKGEFKFKYIKNSENLFDGLGSFFGLTSYWDDVGLKAELVAPDGVKTGLPLNIFFDGNGIFTLTLPELPETFKPGLYSIAFEITDSSSGQEEVLNLTKDFSWGVLAMNFNKSEYLPHETAFVQMTALDDLGHTVCDAELILMVSDPDGGVREYSTANKDIISNPECGPKSVTDKPDFSVDYEFSGVGKYGFLLIAKTANGERRLSEDVEVVSSVDFDIERAGPTRIYPAVGYGMTLKIKANRDYRGDITESVPSEFKILNRRVRILNNQERDPFGDNYRYEETESGMEKILRWQDVEFLAGDEIEISYEFDAPDRSPDFFLLGPLRLGQDFAEGRKWQIASDAIKVRANTVKFLAGNWSANGATGTSTDTDLSFPAFSFKLGETGVSIKNAFIVFESQFEAYADNTNNYTGYTFNFDACEGACTPSPYFGSGRVNYADNTMLAYNESESNSMRLLFDVTEEAQLASYAGGSGVVNAQLGYRINRGTTLTAIASSKATLVVTYTYNADSPNITKTVVYPLESTASGDSGTKRAIQNNNCVFGSTCPVFGYDIQIPEYSSVNSLGQWFEMQNMNYNNLTVDVTTQLKIGANATSSSIIREAQLSDQSSLQTAIFSGVAGYQANSAQQIGYRAAGGTAASSSLIGGEAVETYIASSAVPTSTRTVSFPFGVINNGGSTATSSKSVNVYFPENGSASGTVEIKKAWLKIISNNINSVVTTFDVQTKVGNNASSTIYRYNYRPAATQPKSSFAIYHIIPSSNYSELGLANATSSKGLALSVKASVTNQGGVSAELMITYAYKNENYGYLSNLSLFAGQSATSSAAQSITTPIALTVFPESVGYKIIRGASLLASYHINDSAGTVNTLNAATTFDANLAVSNPVCANSYNSLTEAFNSFTELYKDVTSVLSTTTNQQYYACYSTNGSSRPQEGAKMNGILNYTYQWDNTAPSGSFNSAVLRRDGSGAVETNIEVNDADGDDARALLQFATGTTCNFSSASRMTLSEVNASTTADFGDPLVHNASAYQIGTTSNYITTASGSNSVAFEWLAKTDLPEQDGTYCLRVIANDLAIDQNNIGTTTVYIDNKKPTSPGALSFNTRTGSTLTLNYGATSTETNFREYKIFYKPYDGTAPTENDSVLSSTTDANLANQSFNNKATTTISGLSPRTTYSLSVWAYDSYGNKASSTRFDVETNDPPVVGINSVVQKKDGSGIVDISIEADDVNNDDTVRAKAEYVAGTACNFAPPLVPTLDETQASISADYGTPYVRNSEEFQVGTTTSHLIITSPGSNTVNFGWLSRLNFQDVEGSYCLRVTVRDDLDIQPQFATSTFVVDNKRPTAPGSLGRGAVTSASISLLYATTSPSTDAYPPATNAYKIFYKIGTAGVTEGDTEKDSGDLNAYDYNGASSLLVNGLAPDTNYVFNIWAYDLYGNRSSSTEVTYKTDSTIVNNSLSFVNATSSNIAVAGPDIWNFRAVVSEEAGYSALNNVKLRLANATDNAAPYTDLEFTWTQNTNTFSETGVDAQAVASILPSSSSNCGGTSCTLDFRLTFNKNFANSSVDYDAELLSSNDTAMTDNDIYAGFYEIRRFIVKQIHYRWRKDDGGG